MYSFKKIINILIALVESPNQLIYPSTESFLKLEKYPGNICDNHTHQGQLYVQQAIDHMQNKFLNNARLNVNMQTHGAGGTNTNRPESKKCTNFD